MLTLKDIFEDLEHGELNQFSFNKIIDSDDVPGFTSDDWPAIIKQIRLGLTALHTRFVLREREVTINTYDALSFYPLDSRYSVNSTGPEYPKFIQDTPENPFTDDIIQVRAIWDECGEKIPLNAQDDPCSAFMTNYKTLQYPQSADGNTIFVTYQANHTPIPDNIVDPHDVEIFIPDYLREPLYLYVTARLLSRSANLEVRANSQQIMLQYNTMCDNLDRKNTLNIQDNSVNSKLEKAGWV